ncbi:MAG: GDSL-type esterase/lipase family protein [Chloroflexota bacterium]
MVLSNPAVNEPIDACLPAQRTDEHALERHATFLKRIQEAPIDLLFLGDSITRRWAEVPHLWERYFAVYRPANFGVGGDATQNLLWRIQHGELDGIHPRVIVLLIGTNNAPTHNGQEVAAAVYKIVAVIRARLPQTRLLLMAIFPRGPQTPECANGDNPFYMDVIRVANTELAKLDDGETIRFLDIGASFIGADGELVSAYMPDGLHLVEAGYLVWGDAMKGLLDEMMIG